MPSAEEELHDLFEGIGGRVALEHNEEPTDYPIHFDKYDRRLLDRQKQEHEAWDKLVEEKKEKFAHMDPLLEAFYGALWKPRPIKNERLTKKGKQLADMLEQVESLTEWKQLREGTVLDDLSSLIGALAIGKIVNIPEPKDGDKEWDGEDVTGELSKDQIRAQLRAGIREAQKDVDDLQNAEGLCWGHEPGAHDNVSPQERIALAKKVKNSPNLKRLADLVGRFRFIAADAWRNKVQYKREEVADVTIGGNIADVIPSEFLYLTDPDLENYFMLQMMEQALFQFKFQGVEKQAKGPLVVRIDISGSMTASLRGPNIFGVENVSRLDWAVACALALSVIAKKDKRDLDIGLFDTSTQATWRFKGGILSPDAILALASINAVGGTSYEGPMNDAIAQLTDLPKADIVWITDGDCGVSAEWMRQYEESKQKLGFKVLGIACGFEPQGTLKDMCDHTIAVHSFNDASKAMGQIFSI